MFSFFKRSTLVRDLSWMGVDIHSHILPGIDDGSPDVDSSLRFINGLSELGLQKFIATPHVFHDFYPNTPLTIDSAWSSLHQELKKSRPDLELSYAAEYMLDIDFDPVLKANQCLPLLGNYLLVEMSFQVETMNIEKYIFDISLSGKVPVLAHPERYIYYHNDLQKYRRLKEMGCLFQLNLLSLAGYYGKGIKKAAQVLLKENLIDLVGTDLHHDRHLRALTTFVRSGDLSKAIGSNQFKNREMFL